MDSTWGNKIKLSVFGESHGPCVGVVIQGLPAGIFLNEEELKRECARRRPGVDPLSTPRTESDEPKIISGFLNGHTTGAPLAALIESTNQRSKSYQAFSTLARPGHADYTAFLKYSGYNDVRGGGHFSARLTAPLVFAGAVAKQILAQKGVKVGAHILEIYGIRDRAFDPVEISGALLDSLSKKTFSVIDEDAGLAMRAKIEEVRAQGDSLGGILECAVTGLPAGLGNPNYNGMENRISSLVFGVPAVKGIEFGCGFDSVHMTGSAHNDNFYMEDGVVKTKTNHAGGILGGISNGMPVVFRVVLKPTPSVFMAQETIDLHKKEDAIIEIKGRHDPCIAIRGVPCIEAAAAVAVLDLMLEAGQ